MAQLVTGVVGGAIGFFIGGPYGAAIGFSVGSSIGSMFSSGTTVAGNTLGDIATQTSKEGVARPIIWGRVRPIAGNLIACSDPKIVKEKHSSGGKGGGGATTTTESVYRTYAIRVCEGPITKFVRVWRNNELVYDARTTTDAAATATQSNTPKLAGPLAIETATNTEWGNENNAEFLKTATFYLGGWDQMPDPALEGVFGAGNVPPHRGTAYIVMNNELLDDTGGAVPQWIFEVERIEGIVLTSKPYAIEINENINADLDAIDQAKWLLTTYDSAIESVSHSGLMITGGELRPLVVTYSNYATESVSHSGLMITGGELRPLVVTYSNYATESVSHSGLSITSGSLNVKVVTYSNYATESVSHSGLSITSGSLS